MSVYNYLSGVLIAFIALGTTSCEKEITIDELNDATTRLTIDASIDWEKGTPGNEQTISLSNSRKYFDAKKPEAVTGASVKVINESTKEVFVFEDQHNGSYTTLNFKPVINHAYTLEVIYNSETYTARETLTSVSDIDEITQSRENGFSKDYLEANVSFTDPKDEPNYYFLKFIGNQDSFPDLFYTDDKFSDGEQITWVYETHEYTFRFFTINDTVNVSLYGISRNYYNYLRLLIDQRKDLGGEIFSKTPVPLNGNCFNTTNPKNIAYGYFRLSEVAKTSYVFK